MDILHFVPVLFVSFVWILSKRRQTHIRCWEMRRKDVMMSNKIHIAGDKERVKGKTYSRPAFRSDSFFFFFFFVYEIHLCSIWRRCISDSQPIRCSTYYYYDRHQPIERSRLAMWSIYSIDTMRLSHLWSFWQFPAFNNVNTCRNVDHWFIILFSINLNNFVSNVRSIQTFLMLHICRSENTRNQSSLHQRHVHKCPEEKAPSHTNNQFMVQSTSFGTYQIANDESRPAQKYASEHWLCRPHDKKMERNKRK